MDLGHDKDAFDGGKIGLGQAIGRIAAGEETLREPDRLKPFEHWVGHIPFAFWIVSVLRPRTLVEIGTHRGNSFLAFCQAIETERSGTRAYAVDTWEGDVHMAREDGLFEELSAYHDPRYGHFSSLIRATFDDARKLFPDNSIDLLHIDGTHTYESVAHDFATWEPALSDRAVVLFHDTNVRRPDYGVWKLWEELACKHPHFEFFHSFGLGVLGIGGDLPEPLRALFRASSDVKEAAQIRAFFAARGAVGINRLAVEVERERAREFASQLQIECERFRETASQLQLERERSREAASQVQIERERSREAALQLRLERERSQETARQHAAQVEAITSASANDAAAEELAKTRALLLKTAEDLRALRTSTFWRITGPMRWIVELLRAGRRGRNQQPATMLQPPVPMPDPEPVADKSSNLTADDIKQTHALKDATDFGQIGEAWPEPLEMPDLFAMRNFRPSARIAVVAHLFYPDLYEEILDSTANLSEPFDLFVTLVRGHSDYLHDVIKARFPDAHIWCFPNRGRDIMPFMTIAATETLCRYELICKLHTKRSPHRADGDAWRRHLVSGILPDRPGVAALIAAFDADPDLGLVVADGQMFEGEEFWGGNVGHLENLLPLLGWSLKQATSLSFAGGSIFWLRPLVLRDLVGLSLAPEAYEPEPTSLDGALAHAVERLFSIACHSAGLRIEQASQVANAPAEEAQVNMPPAPRVVAFYLPQFHPIVENDRWWGRGFTEWTNVTKSKPLFRGHRQPRLPGELGFTDLRLPETRAAQAELAQTYGVSAFCYYYYWFGEGRRLLHRPLDEVLATGEPDFPFMICWANEPWSRNWDGANAEVLIAQDYPDGWVEAFARDVAPILRDPRYVRLSGAPCRPVLLIYRTMLVPEPAATMEALRVALRNVGVGEVHISAGWFSLSGDGDLPDDPAILGCDSFFEFPPHNLPTVPAPPGAMTPDMSGQLYEYAPTVDAALARLNDSPEPHHRHPAVMMGWDNTARRGAAAHVFRGATPCHFRRWLRGVVRRQQGYAGPEERLVFVNAWNEWAEGTCLEPDRDFGRGWLEAVRSALGG